MTRGLNGNKLMEIILYLAVFTAPMGAQALTIPTPIGQLSPLRILIVLGIAITIFIVIGTKKKILISRGKGRYSATFFLIWLLYSIISVVWAKDFSGWLKNIYFLFVGVISMIMITNIFRNTNSIINCFFALNLGIVAQSGIGWYEIITRDYKYIGTEMVYQYSVRSVYRIPIAMSGNPNDFALLMLLGAALSYLGFCWFKSKWMKAVNLVMVVNCCILLVMTTSRGVILGLAMSIAYILIVCGKKKVGIWFALISVLVLSPGIVGFISEQFTRTAEEVTSDNTRVFLIYNGLLMLIDTFGFGVGCGQCPYWLKNYAYYDVGGIDTLHNWWVEILASSGIVIFIAYVVFYVNLFRYFGAERKKIINAELKGVYSALCAFMVGFSIACISSSSNFTNEALWIFWAICISFQGVVKPYELQEQGGM